MAIDQKLMPSSSGVTIRHCSTLLPGTTEIPKLSTSRVDSLIEITLVLASVNLVLRPVLIGFLFVNPVLGHI